MTISRRHFLETTAAGVATGALAAPAVLAQARTTLNFAFAPDESGAIQALIDEFNGTNGDGIEVSWIEAPEQSDDYFRFLVSEFEAGATEIDVFGSDVIWTAELATSDWIRDLSQQVFGDIDTSAILPAALNSAYYRNRLWAVPWYTDAGMLFYRRDLLEEAGITEPPATWDELSAAAQTVMEASGVPHGLVLQGGRYEGGVTNALEFIWSAGGRVWTGQSEVAGAFGLQVAEPNVIVLDSRASAAGLAKAREMVEAGVIPEAVTDFDEREALRVFASGDAVFMRNWPFAYGLLGSEEFGRVSPDQVGVARIPTLRPDLPSYSCLGGWNLAISARSQQAAAAWAFIRHAIQPEQQRQMAQTGGFLPVLTPLYDEPGLRDAVPVIALGGEAVRAARARPSSPIYSLLSPRVSIMFNRVLSGEREAALAVAQTAQELETIVHNHRY
jgi:multiple sugar transport system substrate-binding protein